MSDLINVADVRRLLSLAGLKLTKTKKSPINDADAPEAILTNLLNKLIFLRRTQD